MMHLFERVNGRLKDEFGGRSVRVRGHEGLCHLMFGIVALISRLDLKLVSRPLGLQVRPTVYARVIVFVIYHRSCM